MTESTYILALGALATDDTRSIGAVLYDRSITGVNLRTVDGHNVAANTSVQLTIAGAATGSAITIPSGSKTISVDLSATPVGCDSGVELGLVLLTSGERDLILTITSDGTAPAGADANWIVLTAGMLQSRISAPEYTAFTASVIHGSQSDPVPQILSDITQKVRAAVRSGHLGTLGQPGTMPASLKNAALTICKYQLFGRVSSLHGFLETMKADWEQANTELRDVALGKITPETPADPLESETGNTAAWGSEDKLDL